MRRIALCLIPVCLPVIGLAVHHQQPPPKFKTDVEVSLVLIDVNVVDPSGRPVGDLKAGDFEIAVDRKVRAITSVQFVRYETRTPPVPAPVPAAAAAAPAPSPVRAGRDVLIVVDEDSLETGDGLRARQAAEKFLDQLGPNDRVGVAMVPRLPAKLTLTPNRADARKALARVSLAGASADRPSRFRIGLSEAIAIAQGDLDTLGVVVKRECSERAQDDCSARELVSEARQIVLHARQRAQQQLDALRQVAEGLAQIPGPKTMVLVSGGFPMAESPSAFGPVARAFAASQVTLYTLYVEHSQFGQVRKTVSPTAVEDERLESFGVENVTSATGGTLMRAIGTLDQHFERVATELSGAYLLGIDATPEDRDGRPHFVQVKVTRPGVDVRARQQYVIPRDQPVAPSPAAGKGNRVPAAPPAREIAVASPEVDAALVRAGEYLASYVEQYSGLVAEEHYEQRLSRMKTVSVETGTRARSWGAPPQPTASVNTKETSGWELQASRGTRADYLLVKVPGDARWVPFRDVFEVDGQNVRDREDRLQKLFVEQPKDAGDRALAIVNESARYNLGAFERNINVPTFALMFLDPANRSRFAFRKQGERTVDGTKTLEVAFVERVSPTIVRNDGRDMPAEGVFWIEPLTGRVVKSTMRMKLGDSAAQEVTVTYRKHEKAGEVWVPAEMREFYTSPDVKLECVATYSNIRRFQVNTDVTVK